MDRSIIGKPSYNTKIYILDDQSQPLPIGHTGEIHFAGGILARGYVDRKKLTTDKFVNDPFSTDDSLRMYKTGDLGRWLPDGSIEYVGRKDRQVKIRGYRIELGEIESCLKQYPYITQAVLIATGDGNHKRMIAFYVSSMQQDKKDLQQHLGKTLPKYMIPSIFVHLSSIPLMTNGKIDRKALSSLSVDY